MINIVMKEDGRTRLGIETDIARDNVTGQQTINFTALVYDRKIGNEFTKTKSSVPYDPVADADPVAFITKVIAAVSSELNKGE